MYVITGSTGNTGKRIAGLLLEEGKPVRVLGRSAERLEPLTARGAHAGVGSLDDADFLTEAFEGATAVYAMIPPDFQAEDLRAYQNRIGEIIASALKKTGVRYVVHLSSIGAHLPDGTGPITGLHDQEKRLNALEGVNVLHLRPTYFMENFLNNIPLIKSQGINGSPVDGDIAFPMIATEDIAIVASRRLSDLDFSGKQVEYLLGPADISMKDATKIIGRAIGNEDLPYVKFSYEEAEKAIAGMGVSPDVARSFVELQRGLNEGLVTGGVKRTPENTTETSFEAFAEKFAVMYRQS